VKLSANALEVLKRRYLLRDYKGRIIESPKQMFKRVAKAVASVDKKFNDDSAKSEDDFFRVMSDLEFLPNSPTLMNAGTPLNQLSACFVLPIHDNIESIFDGVKDMALIHKTGGGTGFNFSKLRPKDDIVMSTKGKASGPVSFMRVFDSATDVIKQGGKRRGANMAILNIDHPDIEQFISAKNFGGFRNFNFSIAVTDKFMAAVRQNKEIKLINPRNNKAVNRVSAKALFNKIIENAWLTGDPGLIFIDEINRKNPLKSLGRIESTNPCGEQPLFPYESCNLGSINLTRFVRDKKIDWDKLRDVVRTAVHFLDNVIDLNNFPLPEIRKATLANRKIGLGVMGWAEMLISLGIPYDSDKALRLADKLMRFITLTAREKSVELGFKRGSFPNFRKSSWKSRFRALRNSTVTTIAPTGTISIIAGCSSGIEPLFAVSFVRVVMEGTRLLEVNSLFEQIAKERGFFSKRLMNLIAQDGSVRGIKDVPSDIRKLFVTAFDIRPETHVKMQAVFQKHTDNAVSKTCNLKQEATKNDVKKIYLLAHKLKCKGITVYRYGSKKEQVLNFGKKVSVESEYAGGCPAPYCPF